MSQPLVHLIDGQYAGLVFVHDFYGLCLVTGRGVGALWAFCHRLNCNSYPVSICVGQLRIELDPSYFIQLCRRADGAQFAETRGSKQIHLIWLGAEKESWLQRQQIEATCVA